MTIRDPSPTGQPSVLPPVPAAWSPARMASRPAATSAPRPATGTIAIAIPVIAGNLLFATVGFASIKIVAVLGTPAVIALIGSERVLFLLQALFLVVTGGTMALAAQAWGAGDRAVVDNCVRVSCLAIVPIALFLTVAGIALAPATAAMVGLSGDAAKSAVIYLRITALFSLPVGICLVLTTALRAVGDVRTPLVVLAVANVINLALAYLLVAGRWDSPALGIAGAAIASGVSYTAAAAALLIAWRSGRLRFGGAGGGGGHVAVRRLTRIGMPAAGEQIIFHAALIAMFFMVSRYNEAALAAYGVTLNLVAFCYVIGAGFSIASATVVGQLAGAGRPVEARAAAWRSARQCVTGMTLFGLLVWAFSGPIATVLGLQPPVVALLRSMLFPFLLAQPPMAIDFALGGALRGLGKTSTVMRVTLAGLIVRLGIGAFVVLVGFDVVWIMAALLGDYAMRATLYVSGINRAFDRCNAIARREPGNA